MPDRTPEERCADLENVVRELEAENKSLREKLVPSNPFAKVMTKMLSTFEGYQWEQAVGSFFLQTPEERRARLQAIIDLSSELVKIREVSSVGTFLGEAVIISIIEGRWGEVAKVADEELVFQDSTQLNDLWSWFRATALNAAHQAKQRSNLDTPNTPN